MSKPILIVVVVMIDVVFVKKNPYPKKLFRSKRVKSKKVVVQKNANQKMKVQKKLGSK